MKAKQEEKSQQQDENAIRIPAAKKASELTKLLSTPEAIAVTQKNMERLSRERSEKARIERGQKRIARQALKTPLTQEEQEEIGRRIVMMQSQIPSYPPEDQERLYAKLAELTVQFQAGKHQVQALSK